MMRPKRPAVSAEDQALFLAAVEGTHPLPRDARDRVQRPPPPPSPVRVAELPPEIALTVEGDGRAYTARAPGVSRAQVARLRAGKLHVEDTLDLHGERVERGVQLLREFLVSASRLRRCVLVVHGKGTHTSPPPRYGESVRAPLREAVLGELLGPLSGLVHAFATAAPADGGEGATYVLLRGGRR